MQYKRPFEDYFTPNAKHLKHLIWSDPKDPKQRKHQRLKIGYRHIFNPFRVNELIRSKESLCNN